MSEMDQDKDSQKIAAEGDDELESLSSDEKAAFEKIMAEISSATGGATKGSVEDSAKEAKTPGSPKAAAPSPNKEKVAPVEAAPRAEAAQKPIADARKPSAPSLPNATQAEGPSADPQASLDQIMAEIDSKRTVEKGAVPPKDVQNKEAEELSNDQQAALDQIMAEIGSKRKGEKGAEPKAAEVPKESEDLSADQQAALNDIMAEIESKRKTEKGGQAKGAEPKVAEVPKESEDLSADQQAALNDIMAEIKSKRKSENAIPIDSTAPAQADESLTDSQQADLQKIMSEIEAKKARDVATPANTAPEAPAAEETVVKKRGTDNLTMEEFDDELSNLLSNAQITSPPKATIKSNRADVARATMTQAHPSANMAKAGDASLPHAEQRAEPEKAEAPKEYPILKEVQADVAPKTAKKKGIRSHGEKGSEGRWGRLLAKATVGLAIGAGLLVLGGGGYWAYRHIGDKPAVITSAPSVSAETISATPAPVMPAQTTTAPSATPATVVADSPVVPVENIAVEIPATILTAVKRDLSSARQQIQTKISDIHQLKSYYGRGIEEETQKIEDALQNGQIPSYELAVADKKIELGLRAIQRRQTYITKLDTPLAQLTAMSEQLLFMERRAQVYGIVNTGISGLPIESLRQEADQAIGSALEYNTQISIDRVEVQPPSLETIWAQIGSDLSQKANMLAQRAPLNRAISAEICKGNYGRKYLLNALSAETARCLVKWDGKDLYLNGLTELTPDVAQILAQWPGEWISLNSVRDLPAESAKYLAQWPGKRISLNGISALSPEATAYLSQWKGSQLEMVGLQSIGSWENYGTRLFLSEKLRRQLEAQ